jgi:hypothetical protein
MLESKFKTKLISEIEDLFPGCMVMHNDANENQGIPDLLILYEKKWAALEGKRSADASCQPNQPYYVDKMNKMSFARFIFPENKKEVLNDLQCAFKSRRAARVPRSK